MPIAFTLNNEEKAVPITEADVIRIYDENVKNSTDYANPANEVQSGKRSVTVRFILEKGAKVIVAPPETFCEISYSLALEQEVKFIQVKKKESYDQILGKEFVYQNELPERDILPSL
ncbi:hypothetical protein [Bacillus sp. JCM 19041]|uniref:hypothetical protein n=1 Tax=Bacillus sp. JCM 19041 TaxID=1460637 RepID=UPI0006D08959